MQTLHCRLFLALGEFIFAQGFEYTWGQTIRTKADAEANAKTGAGIANSLHLVGLAVDINLFKDGVWLPNTESHRQFGAHWKSLHILARWGGDFGDGNHYSLAWGGRQ